MKKLILVILLVILLVISGCISREIVDETGEINILFCPRENCMEFVKQKISESNEVRCAVYNLRSEGLASILKSRDYSIVVDKLNSFPLKGMEYATNRNFKNLMHNKFCIMDNKAVITGSFNFIENNQNYDNLVYIESKALASNYLDEFDELSERKFGSGEKVKYPQAVLNSIRIENYFCPEDDCEQHLISLISSANSSIYFMTFAFTSNNVCDAIIEKHKKGIKVLGIFESSQFGKYSEEKRFKKEKIPFYVDSGKQEMHHKVFIIDNKTVLTGSYNPTKSANIYNDENILIIHDKNIASLYLSEFNFLIESLKSE